MKNGNSAAGQFSVLGFCLLPEQTRTLSEAFGDRFFHAPAATTLEQIDALCGSLGKAVVFISLLRLPESMSLRVSTVFSQDDVKVIGMHTQCTDDVFDLALEKEFSGVLEVDASPELCRAASSAVHRGELWFPRSYLSQRLRRSVFEAMPGGLSDREFDILRLLAEGATNHAIAEKLFISRDTVRWHLRSIYSKLGVSDRNAAFRFAKNKLQDRHSFAAHPA